MVGKQAGLDSQPFQTDLKKNLEYVAQFSQSKENVKGGASVAKQIEWHNMPEARKQQLRRMHPDRDHDTFPDPWDCQPDNPFEDGILSDIVSSVKTAASNLASSASSSLSNLSSSASSSISAASQSVASSISSTQNYLAAQAANTYNDVQSSYKNLSSRQTARASVLPSFESAKQSILSSATSRQSISSSLSDVRNKIPELGDNSRTMISALTATNPMTRMTQGYSAVKGGLNVADTRIKEQLPTWDKSVQAGASFLSNHQGIRTVGRTAIAYEPKNALEYVIPGASMYGMANEARLNLRDGTEPTLSADRRRSVDIFTGVGEGLYSDFREHAATRTAELGAYYLGGAAIGAAARTGTAASVGGRVSKPFFTVGSKIANKVPQPIKNAAGKVGSGYRSGLGAVGAKDMAAASDAKLFGTTAMVAGGAALGAVDAKYSWDRISQPIGTGQYQPLDMEKSMRGDGSMEYTMTSQEIMRAPTTHEMAVRAGNIAGEQIPMLLGIGAGLKRGLRSGVRTAEAKPLMEPPASALNKADDVGDSVKVIDTIKVNDDVVTYTTKDVPMSEVKASEIARYEDEFMDNPLAKRTVVIEDATHVADGTLQRGRAGVTFSNKPGKPAANMHLGEFDDAVSDIDKAQLKWGDAQSVSKKATVDEIAFARADDSIKQASLGDFGYAKSGKLKVDSGTIDNVADLRDVPDSFSYAAEGDGLLLRNQSPGPLPVVRQLDDVTGDISYGLQHGTDALEDGTRVGKRANPLFELPVDANKQFVRGSKVRGASSEKRAVDEITGKRSKSNLVENDLKIEGSNKNAQFAPDEWAEPEQTSLFEFGSFEVNGPSSKSTIINQRRTGSTSFFGRQDTSTTLVPSRRKIAQQKVTSMVGDARARVDDLFSKPAPTSKNAGVSYQDMRSGIIESGEATAENIPTPSMMGNVKLIDKGSRKATKVKVNSFSKGNSNSGEVLFEKKGSSSNPFDAPPEQALLLEQKPVVESVQSQKAAELLESGSLSEYSADMIVGVTRKSKPAVIGTPVVPASVAPAETSVMASVFPASTIGASAFSFGNFGAEANGKTMVNSFEVSVKPSSALEQVTLEQQPSILQRVPKGPGLATSRPTAEVMFAGPQVAGIESELAQGVGTRNEVLGRVAVTVPVQDMFADVRNTMGQLAQERVHARDRDTMFDYSQTHDTDTARAQTQDSIVGYSTESETLVGLREDNFVTPYTEEAVPPEPGIVSDSIIIPPPLPFYWKDEPGSSGGSGGNYGIGKSWIIHNPIYAPKDMLKKSKLSRDNGMDSMFGAGISNKKNLAEDLF